MTTIRATLAAIVVGVLMFAAPAAAHATYDDHVVYCHLIGAFNGHTGPTRYVEATSTFGEVLTGAHVTSYDIVPPFTTLAGRHYNGQHWDMHGTPERPGPAVTFWLNGCHV